MVPLRVLQAGKPVVLVAVLNALAAALMRPVAKLAAATAVQAAADRQAAAPAALDAEHVAAVPALQAPADAQIYDARGRLVVPGFNDSHQHLLNTGIALTDIRLQNASGIADVKRIAREYIAKHQPAAGAVLHGMGWNQDYFTDENRLLTRADLDDISTDYPLIFERACGHLLTRAEDSPPSE